MAEEGPSSSKPKRLPVKQPQNSFMIFSNENRPRLQAQFPGLSNQRISEMLGKEWRALSEEDKRKYAEEAERRKAEFSREHPDMIFTRTSKRQKAQQRDEQRKTPLSSSSEKPTSSHSSNSSSAPLLPPSPLIPPAPYPLAPSSIYTHQWPSLPVYWRPIQALPPPPPVIMPQFPLPMMLPPSMTLSSALRPRLLHSALPRRSSAHFLPPPEPSTTTQEPSTHAPPDPVQFSSPFFSPSPFSRPAPIQHYSMLTPSTSSQEHPPHAPPESARFSSLYLSPSLFSRPAPIQQSMLTPSMQEEPTHSPPGSTRFSSSYFSPPHLRQIPPSSPHQPPPLPPSAVCLYSAPPHLLRSTTLETESPIARSQSSASFRSYEHHPDQDRDTENDNNSLEFTPRELAHRPFSAMSRTVTLRAMSSSRRLAPSVTSSTGSVQRSISRFVNPSSTDSLRRSAPSSSSLVVGPFPEALAPQTLVPQTFATWTYSAPPSTSTAPYEAFLQSPSAATPSPRMTLQWTVPSPITHLSTHSSSRLGSPSRRGGMTAWDGPSNFPYAPNDRPPPPYASGTGEHDSDPPMTMTYHHTGAINRLPYVAPPPSQPFTPHDYFPPPPQTPTPTAPTTWVPFRTTIPIASAPHMHPSTPPMFDRMPLPPETSYVTHPHMFHYPSPSTPNRYLMSHDSFATPRLPFQPVPNYYIIPPPLPDYTHVPQQQPWVTSPYHQHFATTPDPPDHTAYIQHPQYVGLQQPQWPTYPPPHRPSSVSSETSYVVRQKPPSSSTSPESVGRNPPLCDHPTTVPARNRARPAITEAGPYPRSTNIRPRHQRPKRDDQLGTVSTAPDPIVPSASTAREDDAPSLSKQ
mmetsp:Transcript_44341/g.72165  ORF Transcript_44341/g.72165 Transcript_44341/m.72165 type:complete len:854 (-) Transcript_44341:1456-4017(-)